MASSVFLGWIGGVAITGSGSSVTLADGAILTFGGTSASFPAIRRNGAQLQAVLADESALATFAAASVSAVTLAATARLQLGPTAFGSLPVGAEGDVAFVTDSNTAVPGGTAAGGGANNVLVFYNGTNWIVA